MPQYRVTAMSTAPPQAVWRLLADGRSWPRWSTGLDELIEERSRGLDPQGRDPVGAVRAYRTGRFIAEEKLTEFVDGRRMAYEAVHNPVMRDYRVLVELEEVPGGGTRIDWQGRWRVKPGLGWFVPLMLRGTIQRMADDLAAAAAEKPSG